MQPNNAFVGCQKTCTLRAKRDPCRYLQYYSVAFFFSHCILAVNWLMLPSRSFNALSLPLDRQIQKEAESVRNDDHKICFMYFWCLTGTLTKAKSSSVHSCSQFPNSADFQHSSAHRKALKCMVTYFVQLFKDLETRNKNWQNGGMFLHVPMYIQNCIHISHHWANAYQLKGWPLCRTCDPFPWHRTAKQDVIKVWTLIHADPSTMSTIFENALINIYFCVNGRANCGDHSGFLVKLFTFVSSQIQTDSL